MKTKATKRVRKGGGFKAIHATYVCIPMVLLLLAAAVFLLHGDVASQGPGGSPHESLAAFSKWLHLAPALGGDTAVSSSTDSAPATAAAGVGDASIAPGSPPTLPTTPTNSTTSTNTTVPNPAQASKYAYVTLISGFDSTFRYRGFLYNALIMKKALADAGSLADFIALIGFSDDDTAPYESDMNLLRSRGIITYMLPRLVHDSHKLSFAEMALLKITPWSFQNYKKVQFFDGDVMPTRNMDCFFLLAHNTFTVGAVSPLNSGWYLAVPDKEAYEYMLEKAKWRMGRDWDKVNGWSEPVPVGMTVRGGAPLKPLEWGFNGADMDQGLLLSYYVLNHGNAMLVDTQTKEVTRFAKTGLLKAPGEKLSIKKALDCCGGGVPTAFFAHFTGRQKPWMIENVGSLDPTPGNAGLIIWCNLLDSLKLPINSKTIGALALGSPLGFWNHNFPKGGFANKTSKGRPDRKDKKRGLRGGK